MITEQIKYTNHLGEELSFGNASAWVDTSAIHDYSWQFAVNASKVNLVKRTPKSFVLPVKVLGIDEEDAISRKNQITDLVEKDILAKEMGRLSLGEWSLECFIVGSSKGSYLYDKRYLELSLQVVSPSGTWVKETCHNFIHTDGYEGGFDYEYDFPIDYALVRSTSLNVEIDSPAKIVVYGPTTSPTAVYVDDHCYKVATGLAEGERLEIDGLKKTITKFGIYGDAYNVFGLRDKTDYIFEPIPAGGHTLSWDGNNQLTIYTYQERSEPEWT